MVEILALVGLTPRVQVAVRLVEQITFRISGEPPALLLLRVGPLGLPEQMEFSTEDRGLAVEELQLSTLYPTVRLAGMEEGYILLTRLAEQPEQLVLVGTPGTEQRINSLVF